MQLSHTSWIVRIAYTFTPNEQMPATVDRCTLVQRFCLLFIPWVLLNLLVWIIGGLLLGLLGQPVWRCIAVLFMGKRLVYVKPYDKPWSIVFAPQLTKLTVVYYRLENIRWLDWVQMGDPRNIRCPILALFGLMVLFGFLWLVVSTIPDMYHAAVYGFSVAGLAVYDSSGVWGSGILITLALLAVAFATVKGYRAFATTPSGALFVSHIKEWKEQHCTMYELV